MRPLSFKVRLSLWHTASVALLLAAAAWVGHWALARVVLGQLDGALVSLAETEAAALHANPRPPISIQEFAPGTAAPSFRRLDRFVQIVDLDGRVLARSTNLGTARLPLSPTMIERLRSGEIAFQTFDHFGEEPIRVVALPLTVGEARYGVLVAGSLDDAYSVLAAGRWLFVGLRLPAHRGGRADQRPLRPPRPATDR